MTCKDGAVIGISVGIERPCASCGVRITKLFPFKGYMLGQECIGVARFAVRRAKQGQDKIPWDTFYSGGYLITQKQIAFLALLGIEVSS